MKRVIFGALLSILLLSGCAATDGGSLGQRISDAVVEVSPEHRGLRVCLMAAGTVEVMTDLAQHGGDAELVIGRLLLLQNAINKSQYVSPMWTESDMADVTVLFAKVLRDAGRSRLSQILLSEPTLSNFISIAKRAILITVKGDAVISDINRMLRGVKDGTFPVKEVWKACEQRMAMNRRVLMVLTGGSAGL